MEIETLEQPRPLQVVELVDSSAASSRETITLHRRVANEPHEKPRPLQAELVNPSAASSRETIVEIDVEANKKGTKEQINVNIEGEGESAIPEDKKAEILERFHNDWQHDPANPRNW